MILSRVVIGLVAFSTILAVASAAGCTLKSCLTPDALAHMSSVYTQATGIVSVTITGSSAKIAFGVTDPAYGDIRGAFFDVTGAGLGSAGCTVVSSPLLTKVEMNTAHVSTAVDASMRGCSRHAYDFGAEVGTPGVQMDDIHALNIVIQCNRALTEADFVNAEFGLSIMSVGPTIEQCGGQARISCVSDNSPPPPCPDNCQTTCPECPPTCVPGWHTTDFGTCHANDGSGCNTGVQTREVTCQCGGVIVDESKCTAPKPAATLTCEDQSNCQCNFEYSPWECSAVCGAGTASRNAVCKCGKYVSADSKCGIPVLTKPCTDVAGCLCSWKYTPFSDCHCADGKCGTGSSTRTATCTADNTVVGSGIIPCDESKCGAKEPLSQTCTDVSGCTCKFEYTPWVCDNQCGSGTASRTAKCKCGNASGTFSYYEEDDSVCGEPDLTQPCEGSSGCTCSWKYTDFGTCTSANGCGPGKSTRTATCMTDVDPGEISIACDPAKCGAKQPLTEDCTDKSHCTCAYVYTPWVCDTQCGCGTSTRSASCKCGSGTFSYDEPDLTKCGAPPVITQPCTNHDGCSCSWKYSPWGNCGCASGCGTGTQTRTASCTTNIVGSPGIPCDDKKCGAKEPLSQSCEDSTKCTCAWVYTPWVCSTNCGAGTATRNAQCLCNGQVAADSKCGPVVKTQPCQSQVGCKCSWKYSAFGTCSSSNGCGPGQQTRTAMCTPDSTAPFPINCTPEQCGPKAPLTQDCVDKSRCTCAWKYGSFGSCSSTCGNGKQTRSATCECGTSCGFTYTDPTGAACKTTPVTEQTCSSTTGCKCEWKYNEWGSCSSQCGSGKQYRTVKECSAKQPDGSYTKCCALQCGWPNIIQTCTSTASCTNQCTATPCNGDRTTAKTLVTFSQGTSGTLIGKLDIQTPKYGDIRGVFVEFPDGHKVNSAKCTITGEKISGFTKDATSVPGQSSVNLNGCPNCATWDLIGAFGSEGKSKDDINETTFTLTCTGYNLVPGDMAGVTVGVRITSVGDSSTCRDDSLKLACVMPSTSKCASHSRRR